LGYLVYYTSLLFPVIGISRLFFKFCLKDFFMKEIYT